MRKFLEHLRELGSGSQGGREKQGSPQYCGHYLRAKLTEFISLDEVISKKGLSPKNQGGTWKPADIPHPGPKKLPLAFGHYRLSFAFCDLVKRNHTLCSLWFLAPFSQYNASEIHPCCFMLSSFLLLLSSIPYGYTIISLSSQQLGHFDFSLVFNYYG